MGRWPGGPASTRRARSTRPSCSAASSRSRQLPPSRTWIEAETRNGVPGGTVTIGGREWTRMEGDPTPDERRSLVLVEDGTATVVTGSAEWAELEALAATLAPVEG